MIPIMSLEYILENTFRYKFILHNDKVLQYHLDILIQSIFQALYGICLCGAKVFDYIVKTHIKGINARITVNG